MGWFSSLTKEIFDDALGFDTPKVSAPAPAPQPAVATTLPATNSPNPAQVQTSFDQVQSYLASQSQKAFNEQIKQISASQPAAAPPTFSQTEQGQKLIKYGIIAAIAWLFLFKGAL